MKINPAHTPIFRGINEKNINSMLTFLHSREKFYKKGETILSEGDTTSEIGIVLCGTAIIEYSDIWGNNSVLGSAAAGSVFAESYACSPDEALMIHVTAAEDTSVLFINISNIFSADVRFDKTYLQLIQNLLSVCASRSLKLSKRIIHTTPKSIRGRLMSCFSELAKTANSFSFELPYNRRRLADYLSVDRSAMCNEMSKMQKDGLIRYNKNHVTVSADADLYD